jgi:drug/metabolite transporter (DMT)-like permease|tara:strand:+ start:6517 stop:7416 length:900 start_codon:yes stop_codon:yes gene_type:complete
MNISLFSQKTPISAPVLGAFYMVLSAFCFAITAGLLRYATREVHPFEAAFLRSFSGLIFMLPLVMRGGLAGISIKRPRLHILRGIISGIGTLMWSSALAVLPVGEAVALNFTAPLFATMLAPFVLHEVVRARRWTACFLGFTGVLIMLRPGLEVISVGALLSIGSAATIACNMLIIRIISQEDNARTVVFTFSVFTSLVTLLPALFVWETPSWEMLVVLVVCGLLATLAHLLLTRAMSIAEMSAIAPLDFVRLLFAAGIGFIWFSEVPDIWTAIGAIVITSSAVYIARREALSVRNKDA